MGSMSGPDAAPLPRLGEVFFDVRGSMRSMRLSWYADTGIAVFSIWQGGTCTGTFRLAAGDLPRLMESLQRGGPADEPGQTGGVRAVQGSRPRLAITAGPEPYTGMMTALPESGAAASYQQEADEPGQPQGFPDGVPYGGDAAVQYFPDALPYTAAVAGGYGATPEYRATTGYGGTAGYGEQGYGAPQDFAGYPGYQGQVPDEPAQVVPSTGDQPLRSMQELLAMLSAPIGESTGSGGATSFAGSWAGGQQATYGDQQAYPEQQAYAGQRAYAGEQAYAEQQAYTEQQAYAEQQGYAPAGYQAAGADGYRPDGYRAGGFPDAAGYVSGGYPAPGPADYVGYGADGDQRPDGAVFPRAPGYEPAGYEAAGYELGGYEPAGYQPNGYEDTGYDPGGYDPGAQSAAYPGDPAYPVDGGYQTGADYGGEAWPNGYAGTNVYAGGNEFPGAEIYPEPGANPEPSGYGEATGYRGTRGYPDPDAAGFGAASRPGPGFAPTFIPNGGGDGRGQPGWSARRGQDYPAGDGYRTADGSQGGDYGYQGGDHGYQGGDYGYDPEPGGGRTPRFREARQDGRAARPRFTPGPAARRSRETARDPRGTARDPREQRYGRSR